MKLLNEVAGLGAKEVCGQGGEGVIAWEPERCSCEGQMLYANLYSFRPRFPRRRVVTDGLASPSECRHVIGASIFAMAGLGGGAARPPPMKNGETAVAVQDFSVLCGWVGASTAGIVADLCGRVRTTIVTQWEESRPLYLAGALLTRLQPPDAPIGEHDGYDYSVAHIDKANVASYDYSSVLYLNSKTHSFQGGDFCFIDEGGDTVLEPRQGRCVIFSSGPEHLHQAQQVTDGSRFVLASWYTLSSEHGQAIPTAAELMRVHTNSTGEEEHDIAEDEEELLDVQAMLDAKIAELQQDLQKMPQRSA
jgi:predicted 2-oxoglutarate/Fe(II)-dependent dioxygenase YbiX